MRRVVKRFANYELEYLLQPGKWMGLAEMLNLKTRLDHVNETSGHNLKYGIFEPSIDHNKMKDFFTRCNFCVMFLEGEAVGFFYNVMLDEKTVPAIHAGLVMIARNQGVDLLRVPYAYMALLQRKEYGDYYYTNISSTPSIIGTFGDLFSDVWPNYRGNLIRPPNKQYVHVLSLLTKEYVDRYFPKDRIEIDQKRFVMRSPQKEMGFEQNPRKLSRYHKLEANLFCIYWLDYSKGEDIVQVGRVDFKFTVRLGVQLFLLNLWDSITRPFSKKKVPVPITQGAQRQSADQSKAA